METIGFNRYKILNIVVLCVFGVYGVIAQNTLLPPILLENELRLNGNPFATYAAMLEKEEQYLKSPIANIFLEQKLNMEQFMGIFDAGQRAMNLPHLRKNFGKKKDSIPGKFIPKSATSVIEEAGDKHQIIIWGEEHHLPQTRVLYKKMLEKLWDKGFRYLAAETFTSEIENKELEVITANLGYYIQDPIFAEAVTFALHKGYRLISYDNTETERDKVQAENIYNKSLKKDPKAKVLILAGRGHIIEQLTADKWEPMGYWLKKLSGLDPFTIWAPTMTSRLTEEEHHPFYKYALENELIQGITIFQDSTNNEFLRYYNNYDAYVFFPPEKLKHGRPDWMFHYLNRKAFLIPDSFTKYDLPILIQAHRIDDPDNAIPVDQLLILKKDETNFLALPAGDFKIRAIDSKGNVLRQNSITTK